MRRYLPIVVALIVVAGAAWWVLGQRQGGRDTHTTPVAEVQQQDIGAFGEQRRCARLPRFLGKLGIRQPVVIDLSQKQFKGIALLHGKHLEKVLHPRQWEQYEHFSTYALDPSGNIYLVPTPFISIRPTTFTLQTKLFRLDSRTGKVGIFLTLGDVHPSERNPYGLSSVVYDCDDHTLWVSAIDESDYRSQKGVIYHIDPKTKNVLTRHEGFDALTLARLDTQKGRFLLAGSARDNGLYAFRIVKGVLTEPVVKLLEIPNASERIRRIKVRGPNHLELQTIPFSYSLIAQTAEHEREIYDAWWDPKKKEWRLEKRPQK